MHKDSANTSWSQTTRGCALRMLDKRRKGDDAIKTAKYLRDHKKHLFLRLLPMIRNIQPSEKENFRARQRLAEALKDPDINDQIPKIVHVIKLPFMRGIDTMKLWRDFVGTKIQEQMLNTEVFFVKLQYETSISTKTLLCNSKKWLKYVDPQLFPCKCEEISEWLQPGGKHKSNSSKFGHAIPLAPSAASEVDNDIADESQLLDGCKSYDVDEVMYEHNNVIIDNYPDNIQPIALDQQDQHLHEVHAQDTHQEQQAQANSPQTQPEGDDDSDDDKPLTEVFNIVTTSTRIPHTLT